MQGPFKGVAGSLARAFGGTVTLHHGTPQAVDVVAVFRKLPRRVELGGGSELETMAPTLRASRDVLASLEEGDLIDPKDGQIYQFAFREESESPASDALIIARLEVVP
jgi:hypothetical protein